MENTEQYTLRELQLCELEILKEVKRVCDKHNIIFYLSCGTLLGAVRHKGFIPWDNDIDIEMPYSDYVRFLKIAQEELGEDYFLQCAETEEHFGRLYAKVRKNKTVFLMTTELQNDEHHGVWIDIFPQTRIKGPFDRRVKRLLVSLYSYLTMGDKDYAAAREKTEKKKKAFAVFVRDFIRFLPWGLRKRSAKWIQKKIFRSNGPNISYVWGNVAISRPESIYGAGQEVTFEGITFLGPADYDAWLKRAYKNYLELPPENERFRHWPKELRLDRHYTE